MKRILILSCKVGEGHNAAAKALAELISDEELPADYIIPAAFDPRVKDAVAAAV